MSLPLSGVCLGVAGCLYPGGTQQIVKLPRGWAGTGLGVPFLRDLFMTR